MKTVFHDIEAITRAMPKNAGFGLVDANEFSRATGLCLNLDCLRCSPVMYHGKQQAGNARCGETRAWPVK